MSTFSVTYNSRLAGSLRLFRRCAFANSAANDTTVVGVGEVRQTLRPEMNLLHNREKTKFSDGIIALSPVIKMA